MRNRFSLEKMGSRKPGVEIKESAGTKIPAVRNAEPQEVLEGPKQTWKFFPYDMDGDAARMVKGGSLKDQPLEVVLNEEGGEIGRDENVD